MNGYEAPTSPKVATTRINLYNNNSRVANEILGGLANSKFFNVIHCKLEKEIWYKLQIIYKGYVKVKKAKLQTFKG